MASGLAAAHAVSLIHRDIKPSNILLSDGPNERAKISDFGLARALDDASLTQSGMIAGTPMYMAPEQARGETLDHRADLFSLGSVLYQMASGRPPFRAANTVAVLKRVCEDTPRPLHDVIPEIPDWLETIVFRLLRKKRDDRYQTAREVADLLARCQDELRLRGHVTCVEGRASTTDTQVFQSTKGTDTPAKEKQPLGWLVGGAIVLVAVIGLFLMIGEEDAPVAEPTRPTGDTSSASTTGTPANPTKTSSWQGWPADAAQARDGQETYVPSTTLSLFNGQDLTGWKTHPDGPGNWRVENGELVSDGVPGYLFSERDDFRDFELTCEVSIQDDGDSGVIIRTPFQKVGLFGLPGYEAQIQSGKVLTAGWATGAIAESNATTGWQLQQPSTISIPPNQFFTLKISAIRNRVETYIEGVKVAEYIDADRTYLRGHIALQLSGPKSFIRFRKITLTELLPQQQSSTALPTDAPPSDLANENSE